MLERLGQDATRLSAGYGIDARPASIGLGINLSRVGNPCPRTFPAPGEPHSGQCVSSCLLTQADGAGQSSSGSLFRVRFVDYSSEGTKVFSKFGELFES